MTHKDYVLIAAILKARKDQIGSAYTELLAEDFVKVLHEDNPKFLPAKFLKACGVAN